MNLFEMNMKMGEVSDGIDLDEGCDMKDEYNKFKKKGKNSEEDSEEEDSEEEDD